MGFNITQTTSLEEVLLPVAVGPITTHVPFAVIDEPSSFNAILGHTWIHSMKALPLCYHQTLSFLTPLGHIDIRGDQKAARAFFDMKSP